MNDPLDSEERLPAYVSDGNAGIAIYVIGPAFAPAGEPSLAMIQFVVWTNLF